MRKPKIVLGSAQFGMDYGITNKEGQSSTESVTAIVGLAVKNNVALIDTARAYGNAEAKLGVVLANFSGKLPGICTKLPSMAGVDEGGVEALIRNSAVASLKDLGLEKLDILMFHDFDDAIRFSGLTLDVLYELSREGLCDSIGVSVYTPEQAITAMLDMRIKHIQIPFNYLDKRWLSDDFMFSLESRPDINIHARSIFLQGLLLSAKDQWPVWCKERTKLCNEIDNLVKKFDRLDKMDLCLAFASSFPWIQYIVVGVETAQQFDKILRYYGNESLAKLQLNEIRSLFQDVPDRLINPAIW